MNVFIALKGSHFWFYIQIKEIKEKRASEILMSLSLKLFNFEWMNEWTNERTNEWMW